MRNVVRALLATGCCALLATACGSPPPAEPGPARTAVAVGTDGAVSSVNPYATRIGIDVLKAGGNAVDAAVATAAALGVVEPYSDGLGGGGYFVYYDAKTQQVHTLDGRETAPATMTPDAFLARPPGGRCRSTTPSTPGSRSAYRAPRRRGTRHCAAGARCT
ncbi:MAG TPA: gamma-glutamyltransferase [Pseudonocardia sp.]|nr:gamma-glutamyltransferase [Pseudonocardia sp.]